MDIQNFEAAYMNVTNFLSNKNYLLLNTIDINEGRYKILKTNKETFLIVFKRDFFRSFGTIFKNEGESGVGESLNLKDLKTAVTRKVRSIIFIYPNFHIYKISVEEFLKYGHRRKNKEGKESISINVKYLNRMNPEND